MKKINFENLPSTNTPINATNLNLMQDNIEETFCGKNLWGDNPLKAHRDNDVSFINSIEAGTYTLSWGKMTTNSTETPRLAFKRADKTIIKEILLPLNQKFITFTLEETAYMYRFYPSDNYNNSTGITTTLDDVQLEKGNIVTEYTPHKNNGYESGSNENGSWIKYDDGTLLMHNKYTLSVDTSNFSDVFTGCYSYKAQYITLPYVSKNNVIPTVTLRSENFDWVTKVSNSTTQIGFTILSNNKTSRSIEVNWIALGKWK